MNRSRRQAAEEPAVPLVPRPEEDEYGDVEILNVLPGFTPHDAHAQPSLLPVRTRFGVFYWLGSNWGFFSIYCSYGFMVFSVESDY